MTKRVHTILCWILAMSLTWLPFSVSAEILLSSTDKNSCHEMNSTMPGHDMSVQSMHHAMSSQTAEFDNSMINSSMHESMIQKDCCDQCGDIGVYDRR